MSSIQSFIIVLLFSLSLLGHAISVQAADNKVNLPLTKQSAADIIQSESKGKILSVDKKIINDKTVFIIKVLYDKGKVKNYSLDAATGLPPK
jgi:uncharacterized membrane protein YkoI